MWNSHNSSANARNSTDWWPDSETWYKNSCPSGSLPILSTNDDGPLLHYYERRDFCPLVYGDS